ncbi:MAG: N-acetyltransferase family protein [Bacillota bacterium]
MNPVKTTKENFTIRFATRKDVSLIMYFIKGIAKYEHMEDEIIATEASLESSLFDKNQAEVLIGEENGKPVGFALFFESYSTFKGRANLFLEDIFIDEPYRNKGYGRMLLSYLGELALKRDAKRLEWLCLDWNTPSIEFYRKMGAKPLDDWTIFRVSADNLKNLATLYKQ